MGRYKSVFTPDPDELARAQKAQSVISGIGDFGANVVGDLKDVVTGIGTLAGAVGHDVGQALWTDRPEFLGGDQDIDPEDYALFQMGKALPGALKEDYSRRYGSIEGFKEGLYEDPLSFLGDALTVATLGGYGAAKGAQVTSRLPGVSDDLARLASGASDVGTIAKVVDKIGPGIKYGPGTPLGGTKPAVDAFGKVLEKERAFNPLKRMYQEKVLEPILSEPITKAEQRLGKLRASLDEGNLDTRAKNALLNETQFIERQISGVRSAGVPRIERKAATEYKYRRAAEKMFGHSGSRHIADRNRTIGELRDIFKRHQLDADTAEDFHRLSQWNPPDSNGRLTYDEAARLATSPDPTAPPHVQEVADVIRPEIERISKLTDPTEIEAGQRYVEHLTESILTPEDAEPLAQVMDEVRLWTHKTLTKPLLDQGLGYQEVFNRMYGPARMKAFGAKWDIEAGDLTGGLSALQIDDMVRRTGKKAPLYFPHIDARRLKLSDFLMPWRDTKMKQALNLPGARKSMYHLLDEDVYLKDPLEGYARRAAQISKYKETMNLLDDITTQFGRRITHRDEIASGEALFSPYGAKMLFRSKAQIEEAIAEGLDDGLSVDEAFAKGIKESLPQIESQVVDALQNKELYAIPKVVAQRLDKFATPRLGGTGTRLFFDGPTNVWRSLVLAGSPRWITNNLLGNTAFLKLQGGKLSDVVKQGFSKEFRAKLDEIVPEGVSGGFFGDTAQYNPHLGRVGQTKAGQVAAAVKETPVMRGANKYVRTMQHLNSIIEDAYRRASYLKAAERQASQAQIRKTGRSFLKSDARLRRVAEVGAHPNLVSKAIDEVNYFLNDYQALKPFERNVMRRFIFPFWSFYKHVGKLTLTLPVKHPARFDVVRNLALVGNDFTEDLGPIPEWLQGSVPLGPGAEEGETRFLNTRGANPLTGVFGNPASMLHPLLQAGLEQATGRDLLTGRQFTAPGVVAPYGSEQQFQMNPETGQTEPIGRRLGGALAPVAPGLLETLMQSIPQVELYRDLRSQGTRYTASDEVRTDPSGAPLYPQDPLQDILGFLGVSTTDFNLEDYQRRLEEQRRAAEAQYYRSGGR